MDSLLKNATRALSQKLLDRYVLLGWVTDRKFLAQEWRFIGGSTGKSPLFRTVSIELPSEKITTRAITNQRYRGTLSPDKTWVLEHSTDNSPRDVWAFSMNDFSPCLWLVPKSNNKTLIPCSKRLWLSDSKTWVFLAFDDNQIYAVTGKLASSTKVKVIPLGEPSEATGGWGSQIQVIGASHLIANPKDDLIVGVRESRVYSKIDLWRYEFRLTQGQRSRREFKIPFPKEEEVEVVTYTPQNQRLALLTASSTDRSQKSLYTMRLDGSQRVCLGTVTSPYPLEELDWLPSGKKLSFRYDNALWVVPDAPPTQPQIL
ncbi:hypothetical protein [Armatimonas rosea]|uniref:Uncharacterized protein n=1 Tax=Armatimonas rosea TaxID=685828 RepID=A0A7W9SRV6_ARMRO|nr:hypothetical protein [Armatimonas rosea]MBB6050849.1 hypothetical protein [Armatimonas rosea]